MHHNNLFGYLFLNTNDMRQAKGQLSLSQVVPRAEHEPSRTQTVRSLPASFSSRRLARRRNSVELIEPRRM